jgi:hypothetical protein
METFQSAVEIFKVLVSQGEFNRKENPELFSRYLDTDVHEALSIFEQQFNCRFLYFDDTVYLVPEIDSSILGMDYSHFRSYFPSYATRREVYLGFYIMMFIFYEFYSGKNRDPKKMDFLQISLLIDHLDERFERLSKLNEEEIEEREETYHLNLLALTTRIPFSYNSSETKLATEPAVCATSFKRSAFSKTLAENLGIPQPVIQISIPFMCSLNTSSVK